ncbi:MAG: iron(III) transport system substrate-binding protein [Burkholderiales bacterium]
MAADFKRLFTTVVSTLALSAALAVPAAHAQTLQQLATYTGADREQRLIEGAKKEGSLLFYTTTPSEYANQLIEPFQKKYGIKVNVWRARSELILQRVLTESRANKSVADVIASISPPMEALHREGLLQQVASPYHKDLMPGAVARHGEWASTLQYVFVQAYNTTKVRKDEVPKTYQDLLSPRWKGQLAIEGSDHEWMTSIIKDMGEANGVKFFNDLVANGLSVRNGHPLLTNLVASGEVPLGLTVYQYSVEQAKKNGSPIEWFAIEPAITIPDAMAVSKKAPNPHAALLFYDYMLSPEAQQILAKIGYYATNTKVEPPIKNLKMKVLEASTLLDEQDKSFSRFESILRTKR